MTWAAMPLLLWLVGVPALAGDGGEDLLTQLKVAYLYNFTRFVDWPPPVQNRPFVIAVMGDPGLADALRVLEREGREAEGRPIEVRELGRSDDAEAADLLFLGRDANGQVEAIARKTAGQPVLLVGDTPGYAGRGVAIELFRKPDVFRKAERLRFRIDPEAIKGRGLTVSAQLYDVAEVLE